MTSCAEFQLDNDLVIGVIEKREAKRISISTDRGRTISIAPDKILFEHRSTSPKTVESSILKLQQDVDVPLIWQTLQEEAEDGTKNVTELSQLFFDETTSLHQSAVYRALSADRDHFRRRGTDFEPRTPQQLDQLQQQHAAENAAAAELDRLKHAIASGAIDDQLATRMDRYIRGTPDRMLEQILRDRHSEPARHAFDILLEANVYDFMTDFEVVQANLTRDFPPEVLGAAEKLAKTTNTCGTTVDHSHRCAVTIDDAETREVDDGVSLSRDGELWRIDIDIADPARLLPPESLVDREALKRITTAYLPTNIIYMFPESISCDLASLQVGVMRPALRLSVWLGDNGALQKYMWQRTYVSVGQRLTYDAADALISTNQIVEGTSLAVLSRLTNKLREARARQGALMIMQREWKVRVNRKTDEIHIETIDTCSPSRSIIAELMILTNHLAAQEAIKNNIPLIFRCQSAPVKPLPDIDPDDPSGISKVRGLIAPASLSLHPDAHWGLGVPSYTQITSPLRRYTDLIAQRQLGAFTDHDPLPYTRDALLPLMATIEANESASKRLEYAVTERWALQSLAKHARNEPIDVEVVAAVNGGYKALVLDYGVTGLLQARRSLASGDHLQATINHIRPRRGSLRLTPL